MLSGKTLLLLGGLAVSTWAQNIYNESSGLVAIEAESGTIVNRTKAWNVRTAIAGYSGSSALSAEPNTGGNILRGFTTTSPEVQFRIRFSRTGTYYVWIRGYAASTNDDSLHAGLDGVAVKSGSAISEFLIGNWSWSSDAEGKTRRATLVVSTPGVHTVNVWMKEDGFVFDKIVLSADGSFVPTGTGPGESVNDTGQPTLSVSATSLTFNANAGGSNPGTQGLGIGFSTGSPAWTAAKTASWLTLSHTAGAGNTSMSVAASIAGLAAGTYSDTITISSGGAAGSPKSVSVTLIVGAAAPKENVYVSSTASASGDGSIGNPWTLATVLAKPPGVGPGTTIWMRGGNYGTPSETIRVNFVGTAAAPVIIRNFPGERVNIQGKMEIGCCDAAPDPAQGAYIWIWGLEFTSPILPRDNMLPGIDAFAVGTKIINNVFHNTIQGIGLWKSALNGEAYGNVIYNNGFYGTTPSSPNSLRGHGHGIYSQNDIGSLKRIGDNIIFNQFGWGIHLYGSAQSEVRNFEIDGNISFNNGWPGNNRNDNIIMAGGNSGLSGFKVTNNHFYMTPDSLGGYNEIGWIFSGSNDDAVVTDNYFIGGRDTIAAFGWKTLTMVRNKILSLSNQVWMDTLINGKNGIAWNDNSYYGISSFRYNGVLRDYNTWKSLTGFDSSSSFSDSLPTGTWTFVRKNKCEAGRGHIVVYNWDSLNSVQVDVSSILTPGMSYQIRDAQDFYGAPVLQGTYGGGSVTLPMNLQSVEQIQGEKIVQPTHTNPQFGVFVVLQPTTSSKTCS